MQFALSTILESLEVFAGTTYLNENTVSNMRKIHRICVSLFADQAACIVAALGFTEAELNSVFANKARNPYMALLETARKSEMTDVKFIQATVLRARCLWMELKEGQAKL